MSTQYLKLIPLAVAATTIAESTTPGSKASQSFSEAVNPLVEAIKDEVATIEQPDVPEKTLAAGIFARIAKMNLSAWINAYGHKHDAEVETKGMDRINEMTKKIEGGLIPALPSTYKGCAQVSKVIGQFDYNTDSNDDTIWVKNALAKTNDLLDLAVIKNHDLYPEELPSLEETMLCVLAMKSNGSQIYMSDSFLRNNFLKLESYASYGENSPNGRTIYGDEIFAHLATQFMRDLEPLSIPKQNMVISDRLFSLSELTGKSFKIQSDLPKASLPAAFVTAKLINDLNSKIQGIKSASEVVPLGESESTVSEQSLELFKFKFDSFTTAHNNTLGFELANENKLAYADEAGALSI